MRCPYCNGKNHRGRCTHQPKRTDGDTQYRICRDCNRAFAVDRYIRPLHVKKAPLMDS